MNNGIYTVFANNSTQVSSARAIEFTDDVPGQKVLVFSGIAVPDLDTNDDDDVEPTPGLCQAGPFRPQAGLLNRLGWFSEHFQ